MKRPPLREWKPSSPTPASKAKSRPPTPHRPPSFRERTVRTRGRSLRPTATYRPALLFLFLASAAAILLLLGISLVVTDPQVIWGALLVPIGAFLLLGVVLWFLPLFRHQPAPRSQPAKGRTPSSQTFPREPPRVRPSSVAKSRGQEIIEGFESSAPLLFFGVAAMVISILFWGSYAHIGGRYYPLWIVFLLVGGIATVGGTVAAFVPEDEEDLIPESTPDYIVLERSKWVDAQSQLRNLKVLLSKVSDKELIGATMAHDVKISTGRPTLKDIAQYTDSTGAKLEALHIALSQKPPSSRYAESTAVLKRRTESPSTEAVRPVASDMPFPQAPATAPTSLPPAIPVTTGMDRKAPVSVTSNAGLEFLSPKNGLTPWEVSAFRTALTTGATRKAGESGRDYALRGALESARLGGKVPEPAVLSAALTRTVSESKAQLGDRVFADFLRSLESETKRLERLLKVSRNSGEPLDDYLKRAESTYGVLERTAMGGPVAQRNPTAGLQWALALFRGFLESSIGKQRTVQLVDTISKQAASGMMAPVGKEGEHDELSTYANLVRRALAALAPTTLSREEVDRILHEFDVLLTDLKGTEDPAHGGALPAALPPHQSMERVNRLFDGVLNRPLSPPSPGIATPVPKELPPTPLPTVTESATQVAAPPREPTPVPVPSTPESEMNIVEWEASAFRAGYATGVLRKQNEPAPEYVHRAQSEHPEGASPPSSLAMANAVSSSLMESHRSLSDKQMTSLTRMLEETSRRWSTDVNVPWNPGEPLIDYVVRVRGVLETLARTAVDTTPHRELAGLQWSLTLFKGFLESYLGKAGMEAVVRDVEATATSADAGRLQSSEEAGDELMTYAQLVRNSLHTLEARGYDHETITEVLQEFETFVSDIRAGAGRADTSAGRSTTTAPRPEDIHRMFSRVMSPTPPKAKPAEPEPKKSPDP